MSNICTLYIPWFFVRVCYYTLIWLTLACSIYYFLNNEIPWNVQHLIIFTTTKKVFVWIVCLPLFSSNSVITRHFLSKLPQTVLSISSYAILQSGAPRRKPLLPLYSIWNDPTGGRKPALHLDVDALITKPQRRTQ